MEFGKLQQIEGIDFTMPPDDPITEKLWGSLLHVERGPLRLHVGCPVWGRKNWIGTVYPRGTKDKDFLSHYVKQFNCIELNTLFYALQPLEVIERWSSLADGTFRFCPKFSNSISHTHQLRNAERDTGLFVDHVQAFGEKLGPSFLQMPDSFGPDRSFALRDYVRALPAGLKVCVELRQAGWFTGRDAVVADIWETFLGRGIGTVITDTSGRRDVLHMRLTAPVAFIRFVSNNGDPTDYLRIDAWVDRIKTWIGKGLREVYFFVHSHEEEHSPALCRYAIGRFNEKCGVSLRPPQLQNDGPTRTLTLFD